MGAFFGIMAGISPGPLLALVISETITHNKRAGIKVALAPLITDLPIIVLSFVIISNFVETNLVMSIISFAGAVFLVWLGYECLITKRLEIEIMKDRSRSLLKGIMANVLNPHPYLFWITVGTPIAIKAYQVSLLTVILFFLSLYVMLTGSKIGVAILVDRTRTFLSGGVYVWILRILGLALLVFAVIFFIQGIRGISGVIVS